MIIILKVDISSSYIFISFYIINKTTTCNNSKTSLTKSKQITNCTSLSTSCTLPTTNFTLISKRSSGPNVKVYNKTLLSYSNTLINKPNTSSTLLPSENSSGFSKNMPFLQKVPTYKFISQPSSYIKSANTSLTISDNTIWNSLTSTLTYSRVSNCPNSNLWMIKDKSFYICNVALMMNNFLPNYYKRSLMNVLLTKNHNPSRISNSILISVHF